MHEVQAWRQLVTRSLPGTFVLLLALVTHVTLALYKLANRSTLRLPPWELAQIGLGLLIPFWLAVHVIGTFGLHLRFGVDDYVYLLDLLWPAGAGRQSLMLLIVWLHGCIGLHFWLRLRPWYRRAPATLSGGGALLLPTLSLVGFVSGGREVKRAGGRRSGLAWCCRRKPGALARPGRGGAWIYRGPRARCCWASGWCCWPPRAAAGCAPCASAMAALIRLRYPGGVRVAVAPGMSVLETSRIAGIPHASVCGGRGRCSTCRVRIGGQAPSQAARGRCRGAEGAGADRRAGQCAAGLPAAPAARPLSR